MAREIAKREGVPPEQMVALVATESSFNPNAESSAGALGLAQLMPQTAARFGAANPYNISPEENLTIGARYLKELYDEFQDWDLAHAGYNAGEHKVRKYGGIPPYEETQNHVAKINKFLSDNYPGGISSTPEPEPEPVDYRDALMEFFNKNFGDFEVGEPAAAPPARSEVGWWERRWQDIKRGYQGMRQGINALDFAMAERALQKLDEEDPSLLYLAPGTDRKRRKEELRERMAELTPEIAQRQEVIKANPASPEAQALTGAETWGEAWDAFTSAPVETSTSVVAESLPYLLGAAPLAANPIMGAVTLGALAGGSAAGGEITSFLAENDINLANPDAVAKSLENPELLDKARERGLTTGAIVGASEAIAGGLAARIGLTGIGPVKKALAGAGVGATGGVSGEVGSQVALEGRVTQPGAVFAEGLGESVPGVIETGAGVVSREGPIRSRWQASPDDLPPEVPTGKGDLLAQVTEGEARMVREGESYLAGLSLDDKADILQGLSVEEHAEMIQQLPAEEQAPLMERLDSEMVEALRGKLPEKIFPKPKSAPAKSKKVLWESSFVEDLASDYGLEPEAISATGEGGVITEADVNRTFDEAKKAKSAPEAKPVSPEPAPEAKPEPEPPKPEPESETTITIDGKSVTVTVNEQGALVTNNGEVLAVEMKPGQSLKEVLATIQEPTKKTPTRAEVIERVKEIGRTTLKLLKKGRYNTNLWRAVRAGRVAAEQNIKNLGVRTITFKQLADSFRSAIHNSDPFVVLFNKMEDLGLSDIPIEIKPAAKLEGPEGAFGYYKDGRIYLAEELFAADGGIGIQVLAHELGHAATVQAIRTDPSYYNQIENILQKAKEAWPKKANIDLFGFQSPEEFIAEAISNPVMQAHLASTASTEGKQATLWDEFIAMVKQVFNLPIEYVSLLDEVMQAFPTTAKDINQADTAFKPEPHTWKHPYIARAVAKELGNDNLTKVADTAGAAFFGIGTPKEKAPFLLDARNAMRRIGLGLTAVDQIIREYRHRSSGAIDKFYAAWQERTRLAREEQQTAALLENEWREMERANADRMQVVAQLMHDTTQWGVSPYETNINNIPKMDRPNWGRARKVWGKLTTKEKLLYKKVEKYYARQRKEMKNALLIRLIQFRTRFPGMNVVRDELMKAAENATEPAEVREAFEKVRTRVPPDIRDVLDKMGEAAEEVVKLSSVKGPYFPLRRWGKFVLTGKTSKGQEYTEFFDKESEAINKKNELVKEGYEVSDPSVKWDFTYGGYEAAPRIMAQVQQRFKGEEHKDVIAQLNVAFVEVMGDSTLRKSDLRRKKDQAGASLNMRRAFAERAFAGSWALADIKTAWDRAEALTELREEAKGNPKLGFAVQELIKQEEVNLKSRQVNKVDSSLAKFGFGWFLASVSFPIINSTQPFLVTGPFLAARYGEAKSAAALGRAYRKIAWLATKSMGKEYLNPKRWSSSPPEDMWKLLSQNLRADEQAMIKELQSREAIDATFMQELYLAMKGKDLGPTDKVINFARTAPQIVETMNRIVTAVAAYNLVRGRMLKGKKGKELTKAQWEDASKLALDAVQQTQFIYSDQNKPRYFKAVPGLRSIMMFKMYAQGITALIVSNFWRAMNPRTKGQRLEAIKTLSYLIGSHTALAGVLHGVFMEPVRIMLGTAQVIANLIDEDDDEDFGSNIERWVTKWAVETFGEETGKMIARGPVPGLSQRVGLSSVFFLSLGEDAKSLPDWYLEQAMQLGGPIFAAGHNIFRGMEYIFKGDYVKGIRTAAPKQIRDILKVWERQTEGITSYTGQKLLGPENFGAWEAFWQAVGLTPQVEADFWASRTAKRRHDRTLMDARKLLMEKWRKEEYSQRDHFYRTVIEPFNAKHPDYVVNYGHLYKSLHRQEREEEYMEREGETYAVPPRRREYLKQAVPF